MNRIPVVAAVIRTGSRVLVGRRPDHKRHGGMWEFPGGKIDAGESEVDAVTRELLEEFGVEATSVGSVVYECRDPGSPFSIRFLDVAIQGKLEPTEHTEVGWFEVESLAEMELAPCDARFVAEHLLLNSG